ncbi:hypothetical protein [Roseospirillum parvum]|uniref:BstA-like C-terminal domain-containing protein n=1 Tax=Roseospirillum parvum TaxID=83401 RepID=A0A1G7WZR8_9PROT|nr:hypothetical protein [Roseospirillum parvum]SDG77427.1 hypothetical protein SAMN05421742_102380 [Roseospirillum parvum]
MPKKPGEIEPIDAGFDEVVNSVVSPKKEITSNANKISHLAPSSSSKEIGSEQLDLGIDKETEVSGIGMGVLSDGTPYLNQRGLAALCGVMNAHIGTISSQWNEEKPRIKAIKSILEKSGLHAERPHVEVPYKNVKHLCYPAEICLAILEYYAFDAGVNCQEEARDNFRLLAGSKLKELIYSQVGYNPSGANTEPLRKWHERIEMNFHSAPRGYFSILNEAHTIIYELIMAGADVGERTVPDGSIGKCWAQHWKDNNLTARFGERGLFPHRYPDDHPQSKSNPQMANCYPLEALGEYRRWLQEEYLEGGRFATYLRRKQKDIPPSVAQLAIERLIPPQIECND